jgi:DNA replication licensing factor MCM2
MRIAEAFCKMRLSEYCSAQDIDRAIAVTVDSFIGSQKVSAKRALSRAFAKYVSLSQFIFKILGIGTGAN